MTTYNQNFTMVAGDTKYLSVPIVDSAGAAYTITGSTAIAWVLKSWPTSPLALVSKSLVSGITIATTTSIIITIAAADTASLPAGTYYHECEITLPDATIATAFTGYATILATEV